MKIINLLLLTSKVCYNHFRLQKSKHYGGVAHRGESSGNFRVGTSLGSYADKGYVTI